MLQAVKGPNTSHLEVTWPTDLDHLGADWLVACRVNGLRPSTLDTYAENLRAWQRGVREGLLPADVARWDRRSLRAYWDRLRAHGAKDRPISAHTLHHRQRTCRAFLNWAKDDELLGHNPMDGQKNTKVDEPELPIVSLDEFTRIFRVIDQQGPTLRARNRAIVLLIWDVWPRVNEVVQMDTADIDWEGRLITIHNDTAKGRRSRLLPMRDTVYHALSQYLRRYRMPQDPGPFFRNQDGSPITEVAINRGLWRIGERAGMTQRLGPHDLRRTGITSALDNGADVFYVKELAGHADIKTTLRYARNRDMKTAANAHAKFSPVEIALGGKR